MCLHAAVERALESEEWYVRDSCSIISVLGSILKTLVCSLCPYRGLMSFIWACSCCSNLQREPALLFPTSVISDLSPLHLDISPCCRDVSLLKFIFLQPFYVDNSIYFFLITFLSLLYTSIQVVLPRQLVCFPPLLWLLVYQFQSAGSNLPETVGVWLKIPYHPEPGSWHTVTERVGKTWACRQIYTVAQTHTITRSRLTALSKMLFAPISACVCVYSHTATHMCPWIRLIEPGAHLNPTLWAVLRPLHVDHNKSRAWLITCVIIVPCIFLADHYAWTQPSLVRGPFSLYWALCLTF